MKHYYAEHCPYGIRTISDRDTLMQFQSEEERDEMVQRINDSNDYGKITCRAVTTREVSHAYNIMDFNDGDKCCEVNYVRTCRNRPFFEIWHRPNYR